MDNLEEVEEDNDLSNTDSDGSMSSPPILEANSPQDFMAPNEDEIDDEEILEDERLGEHDQPIVLPPRLDREAEFDGFEADIDDDEDEVFSEKSQDTPENAEDAPQRMNMHFRPHCREREASRSMSPWSQRSPSEVDMIRESDMESENDKPAVEEEVESDDSDWRAALAWSRARYGTEAVEKTSVAREGGRSDDEEMEGVEQKGNEDVDDIVGRRSNSSSVTPTYGEKDEVEIKVTHEIADMLADIIDENSMDSELNECLVSEPEPPAKRRHVEEETIPVNFENLYALLFQVSSQRKEELLSKIRAAEREDKEEEEEEKPEKWDLSLTDEHFKTVPAFTMLPFIVCFICRRVLRNSYRTECCHRFCETCTYYWAFGCNLQCPRCAEYVAVCIPDKLFQNVVDYICNIKNIDRDEIWDIAEIAPHVRNLRFAGPHRRALKLEVPGSQMAPYKLQPDDDSCSLINIGQSYNRMSQFHPHLLEIEKHRALVDEYLNNLETDSDMSDQGPSTSAFEPSQETKKVRYKKPLKEPDYSRIDWNWFLPKFMDYLSPEDLKALQRYDQGLPEVSHIRFPKSNTAPEPSKPGNPKQKDQAAPITQEMIDRWINNLRELDGNTKEMQILFGDPKPMTPNTLSEELDKATSSKKQSQPSEFEETPRPRQNIPAGLPKLIRRARRVKKLNRKLAESHTEVSLYEALYLKISRNVTVTGERTDDSEDVVDRKKEEDRVPASWREADEYRTKAYVDKWIDENFIEKVDGENEAEKQRDKDYEGSEVDDEDEEEEDSDEDDSDGDDDSDDARSMSTIKSAVKDIRFWQKIERARQINDDVMLHNRLEGYGFDSTPFEDLIYQRDDETEAKMKLRQAAHEAAMTLDYDLLSAPMFPCRDCRDKIEVKYVDGEWKRVYVPQASQEHKIEGNPELRIDPMEMFILNRDGTTNYATHAQYCEGEYIELSLEELIRWNKARKMKKKGGVQRRAPVVARKKKVVEVKPEVESESSEEDESDQSEEDSDEEVEEDDLEDEQMDIGEPSDPEDDVKPLGDLIPAPSTRPPAPVRSHPSASDAPQDTAGPSRESRQNTSNRRSTSNNRGPFFNEGSYNNREIDDGSGPPPAKRPPPPPEILMAHISRFCSSIGRPVAMRPVSKSSLYDMKMFFIYVTEQATIEHLSQYVKQFYEQFYDVVRVQFFTITYIGRSGRCTLVSLDKLREMMAAKAAAAASIESSPQKTNSLNINTNFNSSVSSTPYTSHSQSLSNTRMISPPIRVEPLPCSSNTILKRKSVDSNEQINDSSVPKMPNPEEATFHTPDPSDVIFTTRFPREPLNKNLTLAEYCRRESISAKQVIQLAYSIKGTSRIVDT